MIGRVASRSSVVHEDRLPVDIWQGMGFTRRPPKKDGFRNLLIKLDQAGLDRILQRWVVTDLGLLDETETLFGISCALHCSRMPRQCICWPLTITRPGRC